MAGHAYDDWDDCRLYPGEDPGEDVDPARGAAHGFRSVLGRFVTGVTVVTGLMGDAPVGLTCQSFSSVSLDPPLVLFCAARSSRAWPHIRESGRFCVNLLSAGQVEHSATMATSGIDKFAEVEWRPAKVSGAPVLAGGLGHLDCRIREVHPAGDHDIVVGEVEYLELGDETDPLVFFEGRYRALGD